MPRRNAKRQSLFDSMTRQAIQEAVVNLVTMRDTRGITMDEVAAEAGVSKGCLYLHFRSKKELLESVKEISFKPLGDQLQAILNGSLSPDRKIKDIMHRLLGYFDENRGLLRFLLEDRELAQSQIKRQKSSRYRSFLERISRVVEDGVAEGRFRELDSGKVASMLVESTIAMSARRLLDEQPAPVEEDARLLMEVFLQGITLGSAPQ
jgi:TetR/AcrR family transcriptional regulator, acrAB operon repressor